MNRSVLININKIKQRANRNAFEQNRCLGGPGGTTLRTKKRKTFPGINRLAQLQVIRTDNLIKRTRRKEGSRLSRRHGPRRNEELAEQLREESKSPPPWLKYSIRIIVNNLAFIWTNKVRRGGLGGGKAPKGSKRRARG